MGNREIFFNQTDNREKLNDNFYDPLHPFFDTSTFNHTHLFIVAIPLFVLGPHIIKLLHYFELDRVIFGSRLKEVDLMVQDKDKEMVGNYWNLLPGHKQLRWFTKEVYL